mgnify:CR=1 FL=1
MATLSLCITCYDEDYQLLQELLVEFSKQTEAPEEIIISSSGLKAGQLLDIDSLKIAEKDIPVIHQNNEERHMQSVARNVGASASTKDLVMFFDVDDIPHPQKIEVTKKIFADSSVDALLHDYHVAWSAPWEGRPEQVWSGYPFFKVGEVPPLVKIKTKNPDNTNIIVDGSLPAHQAHITLKRSLFDSAQFNEDAVFYRKEDGKFCQDLVDLGINFSYIPLRLVEYS